MEEGRRGKDATKRTTPSSQVSKVCKSAVISVKEELPDVRFHDLRHSAASLLLSLGIHPKVVQELLGHTEISMTMDIYSHALPTMQKDAMEKLNRMLQQ